MIQKNFLPTNYIVKVDNVQTCAITSYHKITSNKWYICRIPFLLCNSCSEFTSFVVIAKEKKNQLPINFTHDPVSIQRNTLYDYVRIKVFKSFNFICTF